MKKYYLHDGKEQHGPYNEEELKQKAINRDTLVWTEGMEDWKKAGELDDLKVLFAAVPPPLKSTQVEKSNIETKVGESKRGTFSWKKIIIVLIVFVCILSVFFINRKMNASETTESFGDSISGSPVIIEREKTPEELKQELVQKERTAPQDYIIKDGTYRKNLLGEFVLEGKLTNTASVAVFKDVVLEVNWMSASDTKLNTEYFTVYQIIEPGKSVYYKLKSFAPQATEKPSTSIYNAVPVD